MPDKPKYYAVLTDAGAALEARALAAGKGVVINKMAVGDCNLEEIEPDSTATALVHETWAGPIEHKVVNREDPNITNVSTMIPAEAGGFWIREVGVFAHLEGETDEILYIYANHAPYYKMLPADGQAVTHELTIPVVQSSNAEITIVVEDKGYLLRSEFYEIDMKRRLWLAQITTGLLKTMNRQMRKEFKNLGLLQAS